jgi:hypothetical protein
MARGEVVGERVRGAAADLGRCALLLSPVLLALAVLPGFGTQDGPSHVYNATILRDNLLHFDEDSTRLAVFGVRLQPVPNWGSHLLLMGLVDVLPGRVADRLVIGLTCLGVAWAACGLSRAVNGAPAGWPAVVLACLLALSLPWLFGFYGFLLGTIVHLWTLAAWWRGRDRPGPRWAVRLALLAGLGYVCHPVPLGMTVLALAWLATTAPGGGRLGRAAWTAVGLAPLVPLGILYRALMGRGGRLEPAWDAFQNARGLGAVVRQLAWIDPVTIVRKSSLPFVEREAGGFAALAPVAWLGLGVGLLVAARWRDGRERARWGPWLGLCGVLLVAGFLSPDTLGPTHGHYLPQRVVLLGLLALVPAVGGVRAAGVLGRGALASLGVALAVQMAFVWEYAIRSDGQYRHFVAGREAMGSGRRVGSLLLDLRSKFRANSLLHMDCWLGVEANNVVWGNYEAAYYYFPVKIVDPERAPPVREFERISILDRPEDAAERAAAWGDLLDWHRGRIDVVAVWGEAPGIAEATARWYRRVGGSGPLAVWERKE